MSKGKGREANGVKGKGREANGEKGKGSGTHPKTIETEGERKVYVFRFDRPERELRGFACVFVCVCGTFHGNRNGYVP